MSAFLAVAEGRARHVLVYRTVQMMGGTVLSAGAAPADEDPEAKAATSAATSVMGDVGSLLAHHAFSAANWVALHCTRPMHLYGNTKEQHGAITVRSRARTNGV